MNLKYLIKFYSCKENSVVLNRSKQLFLFDISPIGLHHPLDGVTNLEYKLLRFIQLTQFFCKKKKALAFNTDR
jgi:hypothetical protein